MQKIKQFLGKIKPFFTKMKPFFARIAEKSRPFFSAIAVYLKKVKWQKLALPTMILVVILAIAEITFAVLIFGFKMDNKATKMAAKIVPFPIAVVNYDFVTYNDYLKEKEYIHHFYQATQQEGISYGEIDSQIVDQLIENKLIGFEALRNNVHVEKKDINDSINSIVEQNGGKDQVEKVLQELYGLSLKQFTKLVKIQLLRDKLNDNVIAKVTAEHILIRADQDAPADKVDAAKAKIDSILAEINGGLDFGEAAKKYSEDTGSAEQGGKLDPFAMGEMVDSFSKEAFATKVGEISAPVRTEFGWHIIKVESRTGKIEKSFADWIAGIQSKSLILKFYKV